MVDDEGERLDWGNDDDEPQPLHDSYPGDVPEDAEDAISLGGDDEDERDYFANQSSEQLPLVSKSSSAMSHTHPSKRESQRLSATVPSRAPSRAQNSVSPTRDSRPPHSSGKPTLAPLMHALPPKPVLVPPLFEQPSEPGILASAMVNRPRKANGAGKGLVAPDGGDPLPPDWEIRYPRNGGTDAYYYNIKTQESTWTRPGLPASGRASPTKIMGGAQTSDHSVPEVQDDAWARRGRVQQFDGSRRNATSRQTSSPHNPDLSYADRHYRPGEGPAPANAGEWRTDRGATGSSYPAESYVRARSTSPQPVSDDRRRTRSTSPQWDRRARRDVSQSPPPDRWRESRRELSQDRQTGHADSAWSRSQEYPEPVLSGPRSPTDRRVRHKDDVEPPLRRRKDDVDSTTRRKDDVEPRIRRNDDIDITLRRKDDTEPPMRRKDNIEPRLRRKDDIESPLRRKDDIEPLPRIPPSRDTSSRHPRDEWQAPRPPPPSSHLRESSPPRRSVPLSLGPANTGYLGPGSNSAREQSRFERSDAPPPGRYRDNNPIDSLPQRRGRDVEMEPDFDNSKRRRLNDDQGISRRPGVDIPASVPSLPAKPITAPYSPHPSQADQSHRRRAPLPPQHEHWRNRQSLPSPAEFSTQKKLPIRIPSPERESSSNWVFTLPDGRKVNYCPTKQMPPPGFMGTGVMPLYDTPSGYISHKCGWSYPEGTGPIPPTRPGGRNGRVDTSGPPSIPGRSMREPDAMDIDPPPLFNRPPAPRIESAPRGGMYSDRMTVTASEGLPRAPRAMVPRDGNAYSSSLPPSAPSPSSPYDTRPTGYPTNDYARGRSRPVPPVIDRRWETNDTGRRSGPPVPSPIEPPQQPAPRDLPERPSGRAVDVEPRGGRGRTEGTSSTRRPPPMSGTNNVPIGGRYDNPTSFETPAAPPPPPPPPPSFQSNDNGYDSRRQYGGDRGVEPSDSYGSRSMRFPPPSETSTLDRQRNDRAGRRPSVTTSDSMRGRGAPEPIDDRISPSTSRQSRFGPQSAHTPNASAESEDRVWFTREQTQAARGPMMRGDEDRGPRDVRDADLSRRIDLPVRRDELPPRRDEHAARQRSSPPRGNFKDRWGSNQGDESYGRLSSSASAPAMNFPRHDRPRTPPLPGDRRQEELAPVKVHPDRVRLLSAPTPVPPDVSERGGRPARDNRRPPERPREYEGGRGRDLPRDLPPKPQDARMGPPRDRSPPSQNGYRPGLKRGGSLLDRLTLHDTPPPEGVSSLRDRVDIVPQVSIESVDSLRSESMMDMDNDDSLGGDDGSRGSGGGRGMGKRRHAKPRRGRRNGAP